MPPACWARQDDAAQVRRAVRADQGGVQQGLRRARRPDQGQHADRATCWRSGFDLLPTENRQAAARYLVDDIKARGTHLSTGFVGTSVLMPDAFGHRQHADGLPTAAERHVSLVGLFDQARRDEHLGTLGRLDAGKGFQDPGMNSFAHYSFGAVGEWLMSNVAGLGQPTTDTMGIGRNLVLIRPEPPEGITWAKATYGSLQGQVSVQWRTEKGKFSLDATIPANLRGIFVLPGRPAEDVTVNGRSVPGDVPIDTPAGRYHIVMPWKQ